MALNERPEQVDPHCADHSHFVSSCPVCNQARANALPYPFRASKELPRTFGFTDNITPATFREPSRGHNHVLEPGDHTEPSLSLIVLRILLRILWPFSRIL